MNFYLPVNKYIVHTQRGTIENELNLQQHIDTHEVQFDGHPNIALPIKILGPTTISQTIFEVLEAAAREGQRDPCGRVGQTFVSQLAVCLLSKSYKLYCQNQD